MHIIPTTFLATIASALIVGFTSPNVQAFVDRPEITFLTLHTLFVDACFVVLITFLVLCQTHDRWIARNQSFPYSYHPAWSFGPKAFNFQLFVFEVFHVEWLSRTIHMINIIIEELLWLAIILGSFGVPALALSLALLSMQAFSYEDLLVGSVVTVLNAAFAAAAYLMLAYLAAVDALTAVALAKIALFWVVTTRTLSHVLEPLPPTYRQEEQAFDDGFGIAGWKICLTNLPLATWLVMLGNVSELGAGMPGRLFNPVIYKIMASCGYQSGHLISVEEAKTQAWTVIDRGWMAQPETAVMFAWADRHQDVGGLEKAATLGH